MSCQASGSAGISWRRPIMHKAMDEDGIGTEVEKQMNDRDLRSILEGLQSPSENPVARARKMVEMEVPPARRGPGWDRHWRELEAYLEMPGSWSTTSAEK